MFLYFGLHISLDLVDEALIGVDWIPEGIATSTQSGLNIWYIYTVTGTLIKRKIP